MVIVGLSFLMVFVLARKTYVVQAQRIHDQMEIYATDQLKLVFNIVELYGEQANSTEQKKNIAHALSQSTFLGNGYPLITDANGGVYASPKIQFIEEDKKIALRIREKSAFG